MEAPLQQIIAATMARELRSVVDELKLYPDDRSVWAEPEGISNSAGTLALHLAGNIRNYVGAELGGEDYVRDREREFAARDLPRSLLIEEIQAAEATVKRALPQLPDARLDHYFSESIRHHQLQISDFLVHLAVHLSYHLGQINYHRRMVTGDARGTGALSAAYLFTARAESREQS